MLLPRYLFLWACTLLVVSSLETLPLYCFPGDKLLATYYDIDDVKEPFVATEFSIPLKLVSNSTVHSNITNVLDWLAAYSGIYRPRETGSYVFTISSDDGSRMSLDGERIVGNYFTQPFHPEDSFPRIMDKDEPYLFNLEFFEKDGVSGINVTTTINNSGNPIPIPAEDYQPCALVPKPITNVNCAGYAKGLYGTYYDHKDLTAPILTRVDSFNPFSRQYGFAAPIPAQDVDDFSIRWVGAFSVPVSGLYRIQFNTPETVTVRVSNILVLSNGVDQPPKRAKVSALMKLTAGEYYNIEIEYVENIIDAFFTFSLSRIGYNGQTYAVPAKQLRACLNPATVSPQRISTSGYSFVEVPVVLRTRPTQKVLVSVIPSSNDTYASPCTLVFTPDNWNVTQMVKVRTESLHQNISFVGSSMDPNYNTSATDSFTYILGVSTPCGKDVPGLPGSTCTVWGDPHFITFDQVQYDFYGVGDHYAVLSDDSEFAIQTRQDLCGTGVVSCNFGIAIKYKKAIMRVYVSAKTGTPSLAYNTETTLLGPDFSMNLVFNDYIFKFPNGIVVVVGAKYWASKQFYYLNLYVTMTTKFKGRLFGLCGTYDDNGKNDYHDKNGTLVDLASFPSIWKVPDSENLFNSYNAVIPPLIPPPPPVNGTNGTNSTDDCPVSNCLPVDQGDNDCIETVNDNCTIVHPNSTSNCTKFNETFVQSYCESIYLTSVYAIACINLGYDVQPFVDTCVIEILNMCDIDTTEPELCSFQLFCQNASVPQCDCLCNLRGFCNQENDCECVDGFTGDKCQVNETELPCITDIYPQEGDEGTIVYITATNLDGKGVFTCLFGTVEVDATIYNNTTVICVAPARVSVSTTVLVRVLENHVYSNCTAPFKYPSKCLGDEVCVTIELEDICYSEDLDITTFCYNVSVRDCEHCVNGSVFIETDCGKVISSTNDNGKAIDQDGKFGWMFSEVILPGENKKLCIDLVGVISVEENGAIFIKYDGKTTVIIDDLKAPDCIPTDCPTDAPTPTPTGEPTDCPTDAPTPTPTSSSDACYTVAFNGYHYVGYLDETKFCYTVSINGDGKDCKDLSNWELEFECGVHSNPNGFLQNDDPNFGVSGWKWDHGQDKGTSRQYCVYVSGNVTETVISHWYLKAGKQIFTNTIPVPKCSEPTPAPTDSPSTCPTQSPPDCYSLEYEGRCYLPRHDQTQFCYSLTIEDGKDCKNINYWIIGFTCGCDSYPFGFVQYNDADTALSGWRFGGQSKGTSQLYCIYIEGEVTETKNSYWAIQAGKVIHHDEIQVPVCY